MKVKVRVAVAVDPTGHWNATGWRGAKDGQMMELAVETVEDGEARYFLEAELEVPDVPVVAAVALQVPQKMAA